jgi:hypothetical protein
VLGPEVIDESVVVDGEIVEAGVGTVMQMIRRDALVTPYRSDWQTCTDIQRAGRRVGWAKDIRAVHLGWDDYRLYPAHLAAKHLTYGVYQEMELIERAPTLTELAVAAPVVRLTRASGVADASVLELTWSAPAVGAALPASVCVERPDPGTLPFDDRAAGAVVLVDPPTEVAEDVLIEATRVGARMVIAVAALHAFGARTAAELAPAGWTGHEAEGPGDVPLALARSADTDPAIAAQIGPAAVQDREQWLELFARGAFGAGSSRLWIWRRDEDVEVPERVRLDPSAVRPWRGVAPPMEQPRRQGRAARLWRRADLSERGRLWIALRRRSGEASA